MDTWKKSFKESTTNIAFHLHLSTQMVTALGYVRNGYEHNTFCDFGRFVPAMKCIISRGLVTWHDRPKDLDINEWIFYRLTPAGIAVCQLLEYAQVISSKEKDRQVEVSNEKSLRSQ